MKMFKLAYAALAAVLVAGPVVADEDKESIGDKATVLGKEVTVDRHSDGVTVSTGDRVSPSISVRGEDRTRDNPQGDTKVTFGVRIETDSDGDKK
jgi:hypothetical protein